MKLTVRGVTRDRWTWITAAETLGISLVLLTAVESAFPQLLALVLLGHLGYSALTSLPMGEIPGRPPGGQQRRNLDLRAKVVVFLREVRRLEEYAQRARLSGWSRAEVDANLRTAESRMMTAASDVAKVARSTATAPPDQDVLHRRGAYGLTARALPIAGSSGTGSLR